MSINNIYINPKFKIIADHLRSSCFLIADGILPSNEGRGYVLRRIMRRAMLQCYSFGKKQPLMHLLVDILIKEMGEAYPELIRAKDLITNTLFFEEQKFLETLEKGLKILEETKINNQQLSGEIAFKLYDTYGFPLDLTQQICQEKNITVNLLEFEKAMQHQKERAKNSWVGSGEQAEESLFFALKQQFGNTEFCYHTATSTKATILGILIGTQLVESINLNQQIEQPIYIILNKTSFYATSGGQKGDDGNIILQKHYQENLVYKQLPSYLDIKETKKVAGGLFLHLVACGVGEFAIGNQVVTLVNQRNRQLRAQNHSATHLLYKALKQVLGNAITQKGSSVDASQLTFDFNLNRATTYLELQQIEELVNFYIRQNSSVQTKITTLQEAKESGAEALFGEKYADTVRVVSMGHSYELCGGTHVNSTGNIGLLKIINENGIASGIRRITAKTGFYALQHLKLQEQKLYALLDSLKVKQQFEEAKISESQFLSNQVGFDDNSFFLDEQQKNIIHNTQEQANNIVLQKTSQIGFDFLQQLKQKDKEIQQLKQYIWQQDIVNINIKNFTQHYLAYYTFNNASTVDLRNILNIYQNHNTNLTKIILFFGIENNNKVNVLLASDETKLDASQAIVNIVAMLNGKGGGGKKNLAMGSGLAIEKISQVIDFISNNISHL
jgi:alanyl-tRNA synthetase